MAQSGLVSNISSDYLSAASVMGRKGRVMVYVEGYDDIAFWRNVLQPWEHKGRKFEITTPIRADLAKGKKVVLNFSKQAGPNLLLCVDSDFDYLFEFINPQSEFINKNRYIIQTYTYAIENYLCYPSSLRNLAVRITKNDSDIFDFERFMAEYSEIIYPIFLWYAYAALVNEPGVFALSDFRNAVRINYVHSVQNGGETLRWLSRQVQKRMTILLTKHGEYKDKVEHLGVEFRKKGVTPSTTYLYMQGHTLLDNVVKILLSDICEELRKQSVARIMDSSREGLSLRNELSYYNNSLRDVEQTLSENTFFTDCSLFAKVQQDLEKALG